MVDRTATDAGEPGHRATQEVAAIPLVEERVTVSKREVPHERVQVRVRVDEHQEVVTEQLLRDDVEVERVPRNVPLAELPTVRLEGTTTIVPVVEEVLVVEKRLMLVEEIHIRRRSGTEQRTIPVTLRREEAQIERVDGTPSAPLTSASTGDRQ